jgi:CDP-paratose 2-epimerase
VRVLVTGGAGFIGTNLVNRLLDAGHDIVLYDNLSRRGTRRNLDWLQSHPRASSALDVVIADVRDRAALQAAARSADGIYHLAAQVAVTTSVVNPMEDFDVNAAGTLNALEAARASKPNPFVVFTSTNKVYGAMDDLGVVEGISRYSYEAEADRLGITEARLLDFHSPYGCSKGAADQYVHDYARIYDLRTTVFRMSCIYGPHQFGNEDQGWVAHFIIAAVLGLPLTIYGDGKQVRDILYVEDLVRAFETVAAHPERAAGRIYNVGGGAENTISIWAEFGPLLEELTAKRLQPTTDDWRPGDQRIYVSHTARIRRELGWSPQVSARAGITRLYQWVLENRAAIADTLQLVPA